MKNKVILISIDGMRPDGLKNCGKEGYNTAHCVCKLFLVAHGNALGHKLAQHQREVGKDQRDQDHRQGVDQRGVCLPGKARDHGVCQHFCEGIRRKCRAQEARSR